MRISVHSLPTALLAMLVPTSLAMGETVNRQPIDLEAPQPLVAVDPQREDYVRIAPGGRYFVRADGRPFTPIGYNHNPDWPKLIESNPSHRSYNPAVTEAFFRHMRESGVNVIRLMVETPGSGFLENPIGTFNEQHVRWLDHIFTCARRESVKLIVTPWDTFWMNHKWNISPYSAANGGPVTEKIDFLTKREVMEAQKKRLRFLVDRWGNTGEVFAWDLLNEIDIWWGANAEQIGTWVGEMSRCLRNYEMKKWGRKHLVTVSTANPMPGGAMGDVAYRRRDLDFATTHLYIGESKAPDEPFTPVRNVGQGVRFALAAITDNRPYLDSESGPIDKWITDQKLDDDVFHNMSWAHLASGGAGGGLRWPYRHPHHLSEGMFAVLLRMSKFAEGVPWKKLCAPMAREFAVKAPEGWLVCGHGAGTAALVWMALQGTVKSADAALEITWPGGPGLRNYRAFNTRTGEWLESGSVQSHDGRASIRLKTPPQSVALILEGTNR